MRKFSWFLSGAILVLTMAVLFSGCPSFDGPNPPAPYHCKGSVIVPLTSEGATGGATEVPYNCNEIILDPANPKITGWRDYLEDQGFIKVDSCSCGNKLELWRFLKNNPNDNDFNVIGIVEDPPPDVDAIAGTDPTGASLNYLLSFEPVDLDSIVDIGQRVPPETPCPVNPVKIAVVDTGVDIEGNLGNSILADFDWGLTTTGVNCPDAQALGFNIPQPSTPLIDSHGHGTSVNGVVAGIPYLNDVTMDLPLEFLNIKVTGGAAGSGSLFKALCGLYYAIEEGANVINVSWGYMGNQDNEEIPMIARCLDAAATKNIIVVAGMGNDHQNLNGYSKFLPASLAETNPNVISVGAIENMVNGTRAAFSNWGANPAEMTITAPGVNVISAYPKNLQSNATGIVRQSGTSFAAPHVTRTVAAIWSIDPGLSFSDVVTIIKNTASDGGGYRILNHQEALHQVCPDFP